MKSLSFLLDHGADVAKAATVYMVAVKVGPGIVTKDFEFPAGDPLEDTAMRLEMNLLAKIQRGYHRAKNALLDAEAPKRLPPSCHI